MKLRDFSYAPDPRSPPTWLWHVGRERDLTLWRVEGLLPNPHVWLCVSPKVARTCYNGSDRVIVRVATRDLDVSCLQLDNSWYQWLITHRRGGQELPPTTLIQWWERLYRQTNPQLSTRLTTLLKTGKCNWQQLDQDLSSPITKLRKGQLWVYQKPIQPTSLSVQWQNWFIAIKNQEL